MLKNIKKSLAKLAMKSSKKADMNIVQAKKKKVVRKRVVKKAVKEDIKTAEGLAKNRGLIKLGGRRSENNYVPIKDIRADFKVYLEGKSHNFLEMNKYCLIIFFIDEIFNKKYGQCIIGEGYDVIEKSLRPVKKKFLSDSKIFLD